jgi:hypothetical protein
MMWYFNNSELGVFTKYIVSFYIKDGALVIKLSGGDSYTILDKQDITNFKKNIIRVDPPNISVEQNVDIVSGQMTGLKIG